VDIYELKVSATTVMGCVFSINLSSALQAEEEFTS